MKKEILLFLCLTVFAISGYGQSRQITGIIRDASNNEPLAGVNVIIKGTQRGTFTNIDGRYSIEAVPGSTIVFSCIGYVSAETLIGSQSEINTSMKLDFTLIDEVVVIGYGTIRKSDLTGSVSTVRGEDLKKITSAAPELALQGKVSGVRVTSNSGAPGSAPTVRIRGVGTFGNPDPIFVVDGVILDNITFLNSADIESIEVLKDASSTAMYGSRGANGVIMVTTKSGIKYGKPVINFSSRYELQTIQHFIDMLDAREFAVAVNKIQPGTFNNLNLLNNYDWQREVYRKFAPVTDHQFSVNGGGEKSKYYAGIGFYSQEGVIPKSDYQRISVKINNEYFLSENISFGHNLTFSKFDQKNAAGIVAATLRAWPTDPPYDEQGNFFGNRGNGNPLASIEYNNGQRDGLRSVGNFYGNVRFLKNFHFKSSFGLDYEYSDGRSFTPVYFVTPQQQNDETRLSKDRFSKENWLWENTLNYSLKKDDHNINALAGYTMQQDNSEGFSGQGKNLLRDDILYLSNDLKDIIIGNSASVKSMISYLFRVNYVYKEKYLLTGTFRRDGSSVFAAENRWGNFPSFAAGWKISEEPFFNFDFISSLKLRGSWGIVGNDKINASERFTLIRNELGAVFGVNETLYPGSTYGTSGNPLIRWEEAYQTDIGAELSVFKGRFTVELDYYRKMTRDILMDLPLPGHFGNGSFAYVAFNAADVLNNGLEFNLNWKETRGNFHYEIGLTGSTTNNEVVKMGEDTGADNFLPLGSLGNGQNVKRVAVGQPIGYFYGYRVAGVFQNTEELALPRMPGQDVGDFRYMDVNNDDKITTSDMTFLGSPIPDFICGVNFSGSYKGFNVSLDFQGEYGGEIYDGKDAVRSGQYNYQNRIRYAWDGEGSSYTEPRVSAGGVNYSQSDWFIYNGSYLRLRNLTVGYEIPQRILGRLNIKTASLFLRGTNIITLTKYPGYTPEIGGSISMNGIDTGLYPVTSSYGIGLNVTF
jgi:TonB-linked SusC/RagA family outer membrane protein